MPNDLQKAGGQNYKPTKHAVLHADRFITGLWGLRSPLRDAASPYLQARFYGSRYDSLLDGSNMEITPKLTLGRRPGHTVYNSQTFAAVNTFFSFRQFSGGAESIKVLADTASTVWNATGGSTKTSLFSKGAGASQSSFLSVGNMMYVGDGAETWKWDGTTVSAWGTAAPTAAPNNTPLAYIGAPIRYWAPNMVVQPGFAILDANGNVQLCTDQANVAAKLTQKMTAAVEQNGGTIYGDYEGGVDQGHNPIASGSSDGGYTNPEAAIDGNSSTFAWGHVRHSHQYRGVMYSFSYAGDTADITALNLNVLSSVSGYITARDAGIWYSTDSGTTWTKIYQTASRGLQWDKVALSGTNPATVLVLCFLDAHDDMETAVYEVNLMADVTLESVALGTVSGVTGAKVPPWNTNLYGSTTDNTAIWQNLGPISQWQPRTSYSTSGPSACALDSNGNLQVIQTPGVSASAAPIWGTSPGSTTADGSIVWLNVGSGATIAYLPTGWQYVYGFHTNSGNVSTASAESNPTGPVLGTMGVPLSGQGSLDPDCNQVWIFRTVDGGATLLYCDAVTNPSPITVAAIAAELITQGVTFLSTATGAAANAVTIEFISTGAADADAITATLNAVTVDIQNLDTSIRTITDIVALFANYPPTTTAGGVILATGSGVTPMIVGGPTHLAAGADSYQTAGTWTFVDTHPDADLNEFLQAPIAHGNDMPPADLVNMEFHLSRVFGSAANIVYYSRTTDATAGVPLEDFPPLNFFRFNATVTKLWASALGLLVFTVSDIYLIVGQGTASSPLYPIRVVEGIGLLHRNAFCVNGSLPYFFTSDAQLLSMTPDGGFTQIGGPIANLLATINPATAHLTYHTSGFDQGLYISDGSGWYRCSPTTAPETGFAWSPKAILNCSAIQSVETAPGTKKLLVGPASSGPILQRDLATWTDNSSTYGCSALIGSIVLAQPGQHAAIDFITTDCTGVGSHPTCQIRLNEISGAFDTLSSHVPDPPQLVASSSIYGDRFYVSQSGDPALCRHMQVQFTFPSEAFANEVLGFAIFGESLQEQ